MTEQEDIETGEEYTLGEYQVDDSSDSWRMNERQASDDEQDPYEMDRKCRVQYHKPDWMLEWGKQQKEESDQEALLKSGKYALLKHSGHLSDATLRLSRMGRKAYKQNLADGDVQDVALWRVLGTIGRSGFECLEPPHMAMIKRPYER